MSPPPPHSCRLARRPRPCRRRRRARLLSLLRILHRQHSQPAHAPRLRARGGRILRLATRARRDAAHGHRERPRRRLYRAAAKGALRADREAASRRLASFVRLDGDRPDHADQSRRRRARPAPYRAARQDAGARSGGGAPAYRRDQHLDRHRPARPRAHRPHGLFLRPHRCGHRHACRGRVPQNRRLWLRLHEKGGKQHAMPCHHNLESYLHEYIDGAGLATEPKAILFQTYSRATGQLTGAPLPQANAYAMIQRRETMPRHARRSFTTAAPRKSRSTR